MGKAGTVGGLFGGVWRLFGSGHLQVKSGPSVEHPAIPLFALLRIADIAAFMVRTVFGQVRPRELLRSTLVGSIHKC